MTNPEKSLALLIIDMQNDFVLPGSPATVAGALTIVPRILETLQAFRDARLPVFHVVREYLEDASDVERFRVERFLTSGGFVLAGTRGCEIVNQLKPLRGEYRIVKNRFSAFMNTELDFILRRLDVRHVVVCGIQYPNCIRATVYDAVAYDYQVTVLTDATTARTPAIAEANILDMRNIGVRCITLREFLEDLLKHT